MRRMMLATILALVCLVGCGNNTSVSWKDAKNHVGETVKVCGVSRSIRYDETSGTSFVNVGVDYPDPDRFTFLLDHKLPDVSFDESGGIEICGTGEIYLYDGVAQVRTDDIDVAEDLGP